MHAELDEVIDINKYGLLMTEKKIKQRSKFLPEDYNVLDFTEEEINVMYQKAFAKGGLMNLTRTVRHLKGHWPKDSQGLASLPEYDK